MYVQLYTPADLKYLSEIRGWVGSTMSHSGTDDKSVRSMELAVSEVTANAIEHGSPLGKENQVTIEIDDTDQYTSVTVSDQGGGLSEELTDALDDAERGRGHSITQVICDEVTYRPTEAGLSVTMVINK